jgi:Domain of unknown function (DUF4936)
MLSQQRSLFVYYKIAQDQHQLCSVQVHGFLTQLQSRHKGLQVELMQRPEASAQGMETWMEIYRHPDGISDALILSIQKLAAEKGLPGPRASELFVPLRH